MRVALLLVLLLLIHVPQPIAAADGAAADGAAADGAAADGAAADGAAAAERWMPADNEQQLRALLPRVDDPAIQKLLDDPRLLLYTDAQMPPCYQDSDGALRGLHAVEYNISADDNEPHGNGNLEFPWGTPGGTHRTSGVTAIRFLWLPLDEQGKTLPVVWYRKRFAGDAQPGYGWTFPAGAIVGEVLLLPRPQGGATAFELRLRHRRLTSWDVDLFRPFPRAEDLSEAIQRLRPDWFVDLPLVQLIAHLRGAGEMPSETLVAPHADEVAFRQTMGVDQLPPLDEQLVEALLRGTTFRSALGEEWRRDVRGVRTIAPTTQAAFHIVPANYDGGFLDVDAESCMRCHEGVNRHVRDFQFRRDWYGRIRGSDGIFSFHPFSLDSISRDGIPRDITLRPWLLEAGWLEHYDIERHPRSRYRRVLELDE
jgi:hypothetical protein